VVRIGCMQRRCQEGRRNQGRWLTSSWFGSILPFWIFLRIWWSISRNSELFRRTARFSGAVANITESTSTMVLEEMINHRTGIKVMDWSDSIWSFLSGRKQNLLTCCLPSGRKAIPIKWVLKRKTDAKWKVRWYKARLVCKNLDFVKTFATLARFQSIRCLLVIAAYYGLKREQMDVVTTFLNPHVEEEIFIQGPQGLEVREEFKKRAPALLLLKGLFDLQQAPRLWNDAVNATVPWFWPLCLRKERKKRVRDHRSLCWWSHPDILSDLLFKVKGALKENWRITDLGELSWCLGIQVA